MFQRALVSVSDKSSLVDFIRPLAKSGTQIISTGGTAREIESSGVKVQQVSDWTGHPEVMGGRVKTLHPRIHMSLLARAEDQGDMATLRENELEMIDLVVVNLYPFEKKADIENIDIGGPTLLRAAAKSFSRIAVVCDPSDYDWVLKKASDLSLEDRKKLAAKAFRHVSVYDSLIANWLEDNKSDAVFRQWSWGGSRQLELRYGENPQQKAYWYSSAGQAWGLHQAEVIQGKALSYNNILDVNAAVRCLRRVSGGPEHRACVAVKHLNPCGVAASHDMSHAVSKALAADPKSVFGGIVALSHEVDLASAKCLSGLFLECVLAPKFSSEALDVLGRKENLRLLAWPELLENKSSWDFRTVDGGVLRQEEDQVSLKWSDDWTCTTEVPSEKVRADLLLAWQVCAHLKSNAIALVQDGQTRGLGMGQVNRVDAVEQALARAHEFHPTAKDLVLASDAFFPFPDSIDRISQAGVKWVIQPGGSKKDGEVLARAKELGVNLVLTGRRHFNH